MGYRVVRTRPTGESRIWCARVCSYIWNLAEIWTNRNPCAYSNDTKYGVHENDTNWTGIGLDWELDNMHESMSYGLCAKI